MRLRYDFQVMGKARTAEVAFYGISTRRWLIGGMRKVRWTPTCEGYGQEPTHQDDDGVRLCEGCGERYEVHGITPEDSP